MEPNDIVYDICRHFVNDQQGVDPALVAKIDGFRRSRNLAGLATCSSTFDWLKHSVTDWRFLRQIEAFFKKNSIFSSKERCSEAAKESFMTSEAVCGQTNLRLDYFYVKRHLLDADLNFKLSRMERYISNVLGNFRLFLDDLPHLVRVTPGATSTSSRKNSLPQLKLKMKLFATAGASPYIRALYRFYGFSEPKIREVSSNRVELVPKNWKTDRTIACEPEGNLPLQLAFDTYAKKRLRFFGIDLSDQSANQKAARHASIHDDLVTVDFSAASDTVSFNTVAWVFPYEWFKFLCDVRTPRYRGVFGEGAYQKFSSMGNGSTFTLETILFAAACHAVGSRNFLVYGDDVILEKEYYEDFIRLTRFLGFSINREKSFHEGPFRESCGLDVFNGIDVTPIYIRNIDRRKALRCHLINEIARIAFPGGELMSYLHSLIREWKLPFVPYQESTTAGVWIHPAVARTQGLLRYGRYNLDTTRKHSFHGKYLDFVNHCRVYVPLNRKRNFVDSRGYYLWFLNKNSQVLFAGPWTLARHQIQQETSSVPIFDHKYVRKWVYWREPVDGMPVHLYWWTESLNPLFPKKK